MGSRALFIGVHRGAVRNVVDAAHRIVESGDLATWMKFCDRLEGIQFAPVLSYSKYILSITGPSLFHIEEHFGSPAFEKTRVPMQSDPGLGWVIRKVIEQAAPHRLDARFEGLRSTLLDGFDRQRWIQSELEASAFETFARTLFDSPVQLAKDFPEDQKFLIDDDAYWSITSADSLADLLMTDDRENTLLRIAETLRSEGEPVTETCGSEILRIIYFVKLLLVDQLDLWISEPYI